MKRIAWWAENKDRVLKDKRKKIRHDTEKKTPYIVEQEEDEEEEPGYVDPVHIPLGGNDRDDDKNDGAGGDERSLLRKACPWSWLPVRSRWLWQQAEKRHGFRDSSQKLLRRK